MSFTCVSREFRMCFTFAPCVFQKWRLFLRKSRFFRWSFAAENITCTVMYSIVSRWNCSLHKRVQTHVGTMPTSLIMVPRLAILDLFHFAITCEVLSQCYILLTSRTFESILVCGSRHDPIGLRQRPMQSRFVGSFQVHCLYARQAFQKQSFRYVGRTVGSPATGSMYDYVRSTWYFDHLLAFSELYEKNKSIFFSRVLWFPFFFF